ncbi:HNH endonuclease [Salmonella phage vB_STy-RN5i1]|uniref:HNH endonuclease n=1 Tax=Salmonella phage vB_STy-RN5i1 TaxID=2910951 RepID=UPI00232A1C0D|nr:HNH endonuclease [Salmonella phage vB_STy-RN5i1]UJD21317.1 HNH endonuclease [Salmonella phage vB_STy-RN5i1]
MANNYLTKHIDFETLKANGYEITIDGQVISHKGRRIRVMRQSIGSNGYRVVNLRIDGRSSLYCVHRLVAIVHIEAIEGKPLVNHIDGNKLNNLRDNLEWVTHSENIQHYFDYIQKEC